MRHAKLEARCSTALLPKRAAAALLFLAAIGLRAAAPEPAKDYPTPLSAADALLTAAAQPGTSALDAVLGPGAMESLSSGDKTADGNDRAAFLKGAKDKTVLLSLSDTTVFLMVGYDSWPFPIPLVKGPGGWHWDTAAGKEEVLSRRIGRNELMAIGLCRGYVRAQKEYAVGAKEYAKRFLSSEGKRDGLYWPAKAGEPQSPLGPLVVKAAQDGYSTTPSASPRPFHGYLFRILAAQGKNAPGGVKTYLDKDGKMTGGFAMVAWPAEYGKSGVMTFVVNQTGIVFEKDLGARTQELAGAITAFDPDGTWRVSK